MNLVALLSLWREAEITSARFSAVLGFGLKFPEPRPALVGWETSIDVQHHSPTFE